MPEPRKLRKRDDVQGAVELGPRSLALLRRILLALETQLETTVPDPGKEYEDDNETWPEG